MVISLINLKGGAGKTTLSKGIAYELSKKGNVLLIDADPQGSIMDWSDRRKNSLPNGISLAAMTKKTLYRGIKSLSENYSYVVIDTPPRLEDITKSAIMASDLVVVPCMPSSDDLCASKETLELIRNVAVVHHSLKYTFELNRRVVNTVLGRDVKQALSELGDDFVLLKTETASRMIFAEAGVDGSFVQEVDKEKKASLEFFNLVTELLSIGAYNEEKI